ncbi:MAG: ATP-binding protein [Elusimicrobiota bacterium]
MPDAPPPLSALSAQDFELLLQATRILSSKLDDADLLESVMKLAARVVKAEAASILLLDERAGELYFNVALGAAERELKQVRLKVGEGLAGWVAENRRPAIVNDVRSDPRWTGKVDEKSEFTTRQILAVPLLNKGRLLGVVEAINHRDGRPFTVQDQGLLEAFASQAAVALENAGLFSEVKAEKEKLAMVFREMSDGALAVDEAGTIRLMNAAAGRLFGVSPADAVDCLSVKDLMRGFAVIPPLEMALEEREKSAELELVRREGKSFVLSGAVNRLTDGSGRLLGHLILLRDVTEARKEEMLKRNFLSLMSHKLKTPLVTISGYAPMLLASGQLNDFQKKALTAIMNQGLQLNSLVDKLLTFSMVESDTLNLQLGPVDAKQAVQEAASQLRSYLDSIGARADLDASLDSLPRARADLDRLREVFKNLLENAVKFNDKTEKSVRVSGALINGRLRLSVEDDGPGIPSEEHDKIFQKFYQIEESFTGQVEGAGLGLALVKRIVEAHGGEVGVDSVPGRGTMIYFTLPAADK